MGETTRRALLIAGGASVVIIGAGAGWALSRAPEKAREPWRQAGESFGDPRLDALAYAILAPNPHNMQPWRIALDGDDGFTLYTDLSRLLPETDPPCRQVTIGFGCFLELFRQAAAEKGYRADWTYFPEGEPQPVLDDRPVAYVRLVRDESLARDPLFGGVLARRTNREPFDLKRTPDSDALGRVVEASLPGVAAAATSEPEPVAALRALAIKAWHAEWTRDGTRRESVDVTRIGKKEINEKPWGLTLSGPFLEAMAAAGLLSRKSLYEPGSAAYQGSFDFYDKACATATAFVWSTTQTNTRADQMEAGRAWVRMQLAASAAGLACQPLSQALEEFPEMAPLYEEARAMLAPAGGTVQMLGRLGYAPKAPPAPREKLTAKLAPV